MKYLLALLWCLALGGLAYAGDMKHPSLPPPVHNGEPCILGAPCGGGGGGGNNFGVANAADFGVVCNASTDNAAAIRAAILSLPSTTGGMVWFPKSSQSCNFASTVVVPRNVTFACANSGTSTVLNYTGSSAALVWADAAGDGLYRSGGMDNCDLTTTTGSVGIFTGGDPTNALVPSTDYGDNVIFRGDKVQGFATGWEQGNNSWLIDWYAAKFVSNATGILIPNNVTNTGENDAIFGGQIINGGVGVNCENPNADIYLHSVSIDNMTNGPIIDGNGVTAGCGLQFSDSHIEQFDSLLHPMSTPIIQIYGQTAFTNFVFDGGAIQLDDSASAPLLPSIMKVRGGTGGGWGKLANIRVSSNHEITFSSNNCTYLNHNMCIDSDGTTWELDSYSWWNLANGGNVDPGPKNVNGTVNVMTYPGRPDLGLQINNAIAGHPEGTRILIPPGHYNQATTVHCPINLGQGAATYIIQGAGRATDGSGASNTTISYNGAGDAFSQVNTDVGSQNAQGCQLRDLTLDGTAAGAAAVGYHFGGTINAAIDNVTIESFKGAGIELENAPNLFTERYNIHGSLWRNQLGIYFHCDVGCNVSMEHGTVDVWLNVLTQGGTAQEGIKSDGFAAVANSNFIINGNVEGTGTGGILIHAGAQSLWNNNSIAFYPECDQTFCTRILVDNGATLGGLIDAGLATGNPWNDITPPGSTYGPYGFSDNNNPGTFNASINRVFSAMSFGARPDYVYSGDGLHAGDGHTNGTTTFTSASGGFTPTQVGDVIQITGAGTSGGPYQGTVAAWVNATTLTLSSVPPTNVTAATYGIGYDNSTAFTNAIASAAPNVPIYFPTGAYLWTNPNALHMVGTNASMKCNVMLIGASAGGTVFVPSFSGASGANHADAVSFVDPNNENPPNCDGGIRDISFIGPFTNVTNLNLIHVSNNLGIRIQNISAGHRNNLFTLGGSGNTTIYLDGGSAGTNQFTELTRMSAIHSFFVANMLTLDLKNLPNSLNNNAMTSSHCDPAGTGNCVNILNSTTTGQLLNSSLEFDGDLNAAGQSVIFSNHRADDLNGLIYFNVRMQSPIAAGTTIYCFNAPAGSGVWTIWGTVSCVGAVSGTTAWFQQEANNNPVQFQPVVSGNILNPWVFSGTHMGPGGGGRPYQAPLPTLTSCGTSPQLITGSTDSIGEIVFGTGTLTSCQLVFGTPYNQTVSCTATDDGQPIWYFVSNKGPGGFTIVGGNCPGGNCQGEFVNYSCFGIGGS